MQGYHASDSKNKTNQIKVYFKLQAISVDTSISVLDKYQTDISWHVPVHSCIMSASVCLHPCFLGSSTLHRHQREKDQEAKNSYPNRPKGIMS